MRDRCHGLVPDLQVRHAGFSQTDYSLSRTQEVRPESGLV